MHFNTNVRLGASLVAFLLAASSSTAAPQSSLATVAGTDKACLSQYCDKGPGGCADLCTKGACGPVDTKGLPCVAIPKGWYDPFTPGTNPNDNTLCGLTVEFTNPGECLTSFLALLFERYLTLLILLVFHQANGKTATAVITDSKRRFRPVHSDIS